VAQTNGEPARNVLILFHAGTLPREFALPAMAREIHWNLFVNTAAESPADIYPNLDGPPPVDGKLVLLDRSLICYVSAPV
jgi:glycogen operon protein